MCSGGGPFSVDLLTIKEREYRCKECGKHFSQASPRPICPVCRSDDVQPQ